MSSNKHILAVDDEKDVLLIVKTALVSAGFEVTTAPSGPEALEHLQDFTPDLIILDMMMPEMTSFDVLEQIRAQPETATTPVIMLTGTSDKDKIREAIEVGVAYYIVKPFEFHDLISKVNLAIADSESATF